MTKGTGQALGSIFGTGGRRPAPRPAVAPVADPGVAALRLVVDRLESVLDEETEALRHNRPVDVAEIGNRKRQGLLEMDRALRAASAHGPLPEMHERLSRFAVALERNRTALGTQLRAVREIADIIAAALQEAESDGTYSAGAGRYVPVAGRA